MFRSHPPSAFKDRDRSPTVLEHEVLTALHSAGLAVPRPLLVHRGGGGIEPYLVMAHIEGTTVVEFADVPSALDQMARFLATLHGLDVDALSLPGLEPLEDPLVAAVDYLPDDPVGEAVGRALGGLADAWPPNRPGLVHGDYWPGNVIWRAGALTAVIDWEDVGRGDPLADLATARVELACAYGAEAMGIFTDRYRVAGGPALASGDLRWLPAWEVYVSASALATMGQWGLDPDDEARRRRTTRRFFDRAADDLVRTAAGTAAS